MIVGILTIEIHISEAHSLKEKRFILRSLKDRIRNKFNVSISEIDANDLWQRCVLGVACIANETKIINQTLDRVKNTILNTPTVELIDSRMEML
jgi:hypothetical protein